MRPTDLFTYFFNFLGLEDVIKFEIKGDYNTEQVKVKVERLVRDTEGSIKIDYRTCKAIRRLDEFSLVHESELPEDEDEK